MVLYFGTTVAESTQPIFRGLFEKFLGGRRVTVTRYPALACTKCGYLQKRAVVVALIGEGGGFLFCSKCGKKNKLPRAGEKVVLDVEDQEVIEQQATAGLRTEFETAVVQVLAFLRTEKGKAEGPSCFISYAWGEPVHERWVEKQLAMDLKKAGMEVILDRWDNAAIGASVPRFVSRIEKSDRVIVVGTPLYRQKYENKVSSTGSVVAAEVDLINLRMIGTEEQKATVLAVLLAGEENESLPPLMRGRVYADFRREESYFRTLFDLILSLYDIPFENPAVADLRESLKPDRGAVG